MGINGYKYYFRKPRLEIVKDIFSWLFVGGAVVLAATSPYFVHNLLFGEKRFKKYTKRAISTAFDRLRRSGAISIESRNKQIYISLTPEGKKKAGIFQINDFKIKIPRQWDKKWRLLTFDIAHKRKILREALRGKLKQLGFRQFQKSIWIHPFDCKVEIALLKEFFGLTDKEVQLIIAEDIGSEEEWRRIFRVSS
jgi:DNA-binding transcriptional regulator PaaX